MIALSFSNIGALKRMHYEAVKDYVAQTMAAADRLSLYRQIIQLPGFETYSPDEEGLNASYQWLQAFILADVDTLRVWTINHADKLRFTYMKKLYLRRFANGANNFVDTQNTYNAYTLFKAMDIKVCPYCEHEYIVSVEIDGQTHRTMEFDHFYPKDDEQYPALAMCFYNLIPSCSACNRLKLAKRIAANPYDEHIESLTHLHPDLEVGVNIETLSDADCEIKFHPSGDMIVNENILALEQRYAVLSPKVRELLRKRQQFPIEKLEEMERAGFGTKEQFLRALFGAPRLETNGKELHTKMKQDLLGY